MKERSLLSYVEKTRLPYKEALQYVEDNKEIIESLYPNALYEFSLNIRTKNQSELTDTESVLLAEDMKYFLNKKSRFISDSAIVSNFLMDYRFYKVDFNLVADLEEYLFAENTSFGFILYMTKYNFLDIEIRYNLLERMYLGIRNNSEDDRTNLKKYITHLNTYNFNKDTKIILNRLASL